VEGVVVGTVVAGVVVVGTLGLQTTVMFVGDCSASERDVPAQLMDAVPPALRATVDDWSEGVADSLTSGAAIPKPTRAAAIGRKNLRVRDIVESALSLRRSLWCERLAVKPPHRSSPARHTMDTNVSQS
jgi:hypothetical protein